MIYKIFDKNRKGLSLKGIFVSIFLVSLFISIFSYAYFDMYSNYQSITDLGTNLEFNETFFALNRTQDLGLQISGEIINASASEEGSIFSAMFEGGYTALKLATNSVNIIGEMAESVSNAIGVPPFIVAHFKAIVFIAITLLIVGLIFRLQVTV